MKDEAAELCLSLVYHSGYTLADAKQVVLGQFGLAWDEYQSQYRRMKPNFQ